MDAPSVDSYLEQKIANFLEWFRGSIEQTPYPWKDPLRIVPSENEVRLDWYRKDGPKERLSIYLVGDFDDTTIRYYREVWSEQRKRLLTFGGSATQADLFRLLWFWLWG